jgi:6-phosphogluconolactonase (cycloisomerase 2 family)
VSVYAFSELHGIVSEGVAAPASADGRAGVRNYPADVAIVPGGRILVTNRGNNTVSLFGVEDGTPILIEEAQVGAWPQHLAVLGSRVYCAAKEGNEIGLFEIDRASAGLGTQRPVVEAASPSWLLDASWVT